MRDESMSRYSSEFKEAAVKKMMSPNAVKVRAVSRETGISDVTLYKWRKEYRDRGVAVPGDDINPENWGAQDKLAVVIETAAFNAVEVSEYCRKKGLYPEQVQRCRILVMFLFMVAGVGSSRPGSSASRQFLSNKRT